MNILLLLWSVDSWQTFTSYCFGVWTAGRGSLPVVVECGPLAEVHFLLLWSVDSWQRFISCCCGVWTAGRGSLPVVVECGQLVMFTSC